MQWDIILSYKFSPSLFSDLRAGRKPHLLTCPSHTVIAVFFVLEASICRIWILSNTCLFLPVSSMALRTNV